MGTVAGFDAVAELAYNAQAALAYLQAAQPPAPGSLLARLGATFALAAWVEPEDRLAALQAKFQGLIRLASA